MKPPDDDVVGRAGASWARTPEQPSSPPAEAADGAATFLPCSFASSNASLISGVTSAGVIAIPGSMASAWANCFSPSSRFLNPSMITTPM